MFGWLSAGDGARLALEAGQAVGIGARRLGGQHLERDVAAEPRVARAVDLAHAARAERGDDLVGAEPSAVASGIARRPARVCQILPWDGPRRKGRR